MDPFQRCLTDRHSRRKFAKDCIIWIWSIDNCVIFRLFTMDVQANLLWKATTSVGQRPRFWEEYNNNNGCASWIDSHHRSLSGSIPDSYHYVYSGNVP